MFQRSVAILFDLDGTLVETAPDLALATDHVLESFGRPKVGLAQVKDMVGDGALALIRRGFAATGAAPDEATLREGFRRFIAYYGDHIADESRPFPGVVAALDRLRAAGCPMAVCTNKLEGLSRDLLDRLDLSGYFGAVVGGDTLPVRKPDPGHIHGTRDRLAAGEMPAVMIGDSINDIAAAKAAGIPSIAVSFGYTRIPPHDLGADIVIDHFDDLIPALQRLV